MFANRFLADAVSSNCPAQQIPLADYVLAIGVNKDKGNIYNSCLQMHSVSWEYLLFLCCFWRLGICSGKMKISFTHLLGIGDPLVYLPRKLKSTYFTAKITLGIC